MQRDPEDMHDPVGPTLFSLSIGRSALNQLLAQALLFIDLNRWFDRVDLVGEVLRQLSVCSHHTLLFRLI